MNVEDRIQMGKIQQFAHQRTGAGTFQIPLTRLCPGVENNQFADAGAVNGRDAAKIAAAKPQAGAELER